MKILIGLISIGLLIHYGSADVSHLTMNNNNGYLPPDAGQNSFIEQNYNGINSPQSDNEVGKPQFPSGIEDVSAGYLGPYKGYSQQNHDQQQYKQEDHGTNHDQGQNNIHNLQQEQNSGYSQSSEGQEQQDHPSHQEDRGYLPPVNGGQLNGQQHQTHHSHQEDRGYLPPVGGQLNGQEHQTHHSHQEDRGYLPPVGGQLNGQEHQTHHSHQEDRGYLPPVGEQLNGQEHQTHHSHQEDRGYLPPHQEKHQDHDHHHNSHQQMQSNIDPNLEISYYNNFAVPFQQNNNNHEHSKNCNSHQEYEDNSHGYKYSPPSLGFQDDHQHHNHQAHQQNNINVEPQGVGNFMATNQNSFQNSVQSHQDVSQHHHHTEQESRDYLPPISQGHEHSNNYEDNNSDQGKNRDYLPPIGALELPQSSDTLHIVPPIQLGLPIQKSNTQPETNHINVPLPIPQLGYFFIPGVVTKLPNLSEAKTEHVSPAINIGENEGQEHNQQHHQQQYHQQHQITQQQLITTNEISPEIEQTRPAAKSSFRIIPSIQTAQDIASRGYLTPSQVVAQHAHYADVDFESPELNHHIESVQQNFPPFIQTQQDEVSFVNQQLQQNQNEHQHSQHHHEHHSQNNIQNFAKSVVHDVSNHQQNQISSTLEAPINDYHHQQEQTFQNHAHSQHGSTDVSGINNRVTNLQTYMDNVNPTDRYGYLQFEPLQAIDSIPPPVNPPLMFSKPTAIQASSYAPGMTYKFSNNVPSNLNSHHAAGYLPPSGTSKSQSQSQESQLEYSPSVGFELNGETKKDLEQQRDQEMAVLPLANIIGLPDDEMSQIMEKLQGHIFRTIQITNHHDHSVKNIKVLDSSNKSGERTIEILGPSDENPMGDHKVLHVISKIPNAQGIHQTIKIFNDSKEATTKMPTNNGYLPPSKLDTSAHKFRQTSRRSF